jgi:hypothetical protein
MGCCSSNPQGIQHTESNAVIEQIFEEDIFSDQRPSDMTHLNAQNQIEDYNH